MPAMAVLSGSLVHDFHNSVVDGFLVLFLFVVVEIISIVVKEHLPAILTHSLALCLFALLLPPELAQLFEFSWETLYTVLLHCDMCIEMVEGTICFGAPRPVTDVVTGDLLLCGRNIVSSNTMQN